MGLIGGFACVVVCSSVSLTASVCLYILHCTAQLFTASPDALFMIINECTLSQWFDSFCCLSLSLYVVCVCFCVCVHGILMSNTPAPAPSLTLNCSSTSKVNQRQSHRVGSYCPIHCSLKFYVFGRQRSESDAVPLAGAGPRRSITLVCSWWPSSLTAPQTLSLDLSHTRLVGFLLWHPFILPLVILISPPSTFS